MLAGVWPFHCHINWHHFMGSALWFKEGDLKELPPPPANLPKCAKTCTYTFAPWSNSQVQSAYGGSGFPLPLAGR